MSELLSHEETLKLIIDAQNGDREAEETLVVKNAALVRDVLVS